MAGTYEQASLGEPRSTADPKWLAQFKGMNEQLNSSNDLEDTGLASPNNSAYRVLVEAANFMSLDLVAGTYTLSSAASGSVSPVASGSNLLGGSAYPPLFYFDDADYTVANKTQKLRVRAQVAANATKPALKFTFGLYPVTIAGGADELKLTLGTVVSGSTVEFNEPTASTVGQSNSGDFTIPSDGAYALGVVTSATLTNNAAVLLSAQLQTRSV